MDWYPTLKPPGHDWPILAGSIQPDPANVPQITKKGVRIIEHMMGDESCGTHDEWFVRRCVPIGGTNLVWVGDVVVVDPD